MSPPLPAVAEGPLVSYLVGRLDRAFRNRLLEILAAHELSIAQFTALSVLHRRPGLSNAQLARRGLITPQSMIQVTAALEARGLVQRAPDPAHQRVLRAELTASGAELIAAAESDTRAFETTLFDALGSSTEGAEVREALERLLAVVIG